MTAGAVAAAAALHLKAYDAYPNARLGREYARAFIDWFRGAEDAVALTAQVDGELAGYVVGAPVGYGFRMIRSTWLPAAVGLLTRPGLLLDPAVRQAIRRRMARPGHASLVGTHLDLALPTFSLTSIAVDPRHQGRGVGKGLLSAFEAATSAQGARSIRLSVYDDNRRAIGLYERNGFTRDGWTASEPPQLSFAKNLEPVNGSIPPHA